MNRTTNALLSAFLLATSACAAPDARDDVASDEGAVASASRFFCGREGWDADITLRFSGSGKMLAIEWGLDNVVEGSGVLDPDYRPRPDNANFVRFEGFRGLAGAFGAADAPDRTTVLVEKPLLAGDAGRVKLQFVRASGEFEQQINDCTPE